VIFLKYIAHRGLKNNEIKENTIAAFENAINSKIMDGFEFDIRQTKDKYFVVNHNAFINNDLIKIKRYRTLKKKYNLPTLNDVLKLKTDKLILVEIKDINANIRKIAKILNSYPDKNIYVMSFHNHVISKLKHYQKNFKLGILNYILNTEDNYDFDFICLLNNLATKELIDYYRKKNVEVFMYGVLNEEKDLIFEDTYYILDYEPRKKAE
jgi:glycerophosphoryl diester phosphodiesterase